MSSERGTYGPAQIARLGAQMAPYPAAPDAHLLRLVATLYASLT